MKKLLMSAIVLSCFGIAISLFQISCQKDATAQTGGSFTLPPATTTTLGGIIVGSGLNVTSSGVISVPYGNSTAQINKVIYSKANNGTYEIWVCNYDGSGAATREEFYRHIRRFKITNGGKNDGFTRRCF